MNQISEYDVRIQKLSTLRECGINPYVQTRDKTSDVSTLRAVDVTSLRTIEEILT